MEESVKTLDADRDGFQTLLQQWRQMGETIESLKNEHVHSEHCTPTTMFNDNNISGQNDLSEAVSSEENTEVEITTPTLSAAWRNNHGTVIKTSTDDGSSVTQTFIANTDDESEVNLQGENTLTTVQQGRISLDRLPTLAIRGKCIVCEQLKRKCAPKKRFKILEISQSIIAIADQDGRCPHCAAENKDCIIVLPNMLPANTISSRILWSPSHSSQEDAWKMCKDNVYDNWRFRRQTLEPWALNIISKYFPEIEPWATKPESEHPFGMYGDQNRHRYLPNRCFLQDILYPCKDEKAYPDPSQNNQITHSTEVEPTVHMQRY